MTWMQQLIPKRVFIVGINIIALMVCYFDDEVRCDLSSIVSLVVAFAIVNWAIWRSSKEFPEWK